MAGINFQARLLRMNSKDTPAYCRGSPSVHEPSAPTGTKAATGLPKYDAACRALAEAKSVDEVKELRDRVLAMRLYAKQTRNKEMEANAAEIRERAERRLGEMIRTQGDAGLLNPGTRLRGGGTGAGGFVADPPADRPTLKDLGINKALANKARKAWALPEEIWEAARAEHRRQIRQIPASSHCLE